MRKPEDENAVNPKHAGTTAKSILDSMQRGQVASISVDMDKKCNKCGNMGATESGECLACVSKRIIKSKPEVEKSARSKRPEQMEASALVPKLDGVGRAGRRLAEAISALEDAQDEKGKAEQGLITALKRAKRTSFQTMGFKFALSHIGPKDKIAVQKPK